MVINPKVNDTINDHKYSQTLGFFRKTYLFPSTWVTLIPTFPPKHKVKMPLNFRSLDNCSWFNSSHSGNFRERHHRPSETNLQVVIARWMAKQHRAVCKPCRAYPTCWRPFDVRTDYGPRKVGASGSLSWWICHSSDIVANWNKRTVRFSMPGPRPLGMVVTVMSTSDWFQSWSVLFVHINNH